MKEEKWVSLWGNAVSVTANNPERYAKDTTLRYVIRPTLSGKQVRLTFSNFDGKEPVTLKDITLGITSEKDAGAYISSTQVPVTFSGVHMVTLLPGQIVQSDVVPFTVNRGQDFAVSFYVGDYTDMSSGVATSGPLTVGFFARGRYADREVLPLEMRKATNVFYFLNTIDVLTDDCAHAIVAFGDSITQQSWPEQLTCRLLNQKIENLSVVRRAIGGARVLREYTCLENEHYGRKGIDRFERELLLTSSVTTVIVLHGINDIIHPQDDHPFRPASHQPTPQMLIDGLRVYVQVAHRHGVKIYLSTIPPFKGWHTYNEGKEELRGKVNAWVRNNKEADGYVDFAHVLEDPADEALGLNAYNSGDHLHPSLAGAHAMAEAIPEEWLK